jgi:hypothetical protein
MKFNAFWCTGLIIIVKQQNVVDEKNVSGWIVHPWGQQLRTNLNSVVLHTSERCRNQRTVALLLVVCCFLHLLLLFYDRSEKMSWRSSRTALHKVGTYSYYCLISQFFFRAGGSRIIWFVAAAVVLVVVSPKTRYSRSFVQLWCGGFHI